MDNNQAIQTVPPPPPKQSILLDTNIMSRIDSTERGKSLTAYLVELLGRGFGFAISDITIYELLRGNTKSKETEMLNFLNPWPRYHLDENVIIASAQFDNIMKLESIDVKSVDQGDKFIAATSALTGSLVLTANSRDFPWPLFQEVERKPIYYEEGHKQRCFLLALLKPDNDTISLRFNERP